jgi:hypothetical protein
MLQILICDAKTSLKVLGVYRKIILKLFLISQSKEFGVNSSGFGPSGELL